MKRYKKNYKKIFNFEKRFSEKMTDTDLLNFLQFLTDRKLYSGKVIMRNSTTGRGWRLHETSAGHSNSDVRKAIIKYISSGDWIE